MITSQEFDHYAKEAERREASLGFIRSIYDRLMWKHFNKAWCPKCQKMTYWSYDEEGPVVSQWVPGVEEGEGEWVYKKRVDYEKMSCQCGLSFIFVEGKLYDIDTKDW